MANPNMQVHKMVRKYAIQIAEKFVEQKLRDNKWLKYYENLFPGFTTKQIENMLVIHAWPSYIDQARRILAQRLTDNRVSKKDKEDIKDALIKDANCGRGKIRTHVLPKIPTEMLN